MNKEIKSSKKIPRDNFSKSPETQLRINEQEFIAPWVITPKAKKQNSQKKIKKEFQDSFYYFG